MLLVDGATPLHVDVRHAERGGEGLCRRSGSGQLVAEAGMVAHICITRCIDHHPWGNRDVPGLGGDEQRFDPAVAQDNILQEGVEQNLSAGVDDELLPHHLEVFCQIRDTRACSVGVRSLDDLADGAQAGNDVVADSGNDLAGSIARRVEAVERVEHCRGVAAEERQLLDEQCAGPIARRGNRRRRSGSPGADDNDVKWSVRGGAGQGRLDN